MDGERERQDRYWAAFGQWIKQRLSEQKPKKWTQDHLRDEVQRVSGIDVERTWINQVANGARPSPELRRAIERLLGDFPEPESTTGGDQAALARAIVRLTEELRESHQDRTTLVDRVEALEVAVRHLTERADAADGARDPLRETTG